MFLGAPVENFILVVGRPMRSTGPVGKKGLCIYPSFQGFWLFWCSRLCIFFNDKMFTIHSSTMKATVSVTQAKHIWATHWGYLATVLHVVLGTIIQGKRLEKHQRRTIPEEAEVQNYFLQMHSCLHSGCIPLSLPLALPFSDLPTMSLHISNLHAEIHEFTNRSCTAEGKQQNHEHVFQ